MYYIQVPISNKILSFLQPEKKINFILSLAVTIYYSHCELLFCDFFFNINLLSPFCCQTLSILMTLIFKRKIDAYA